MKLPNFFSVAVAMIGLALTSFAADYADWVAKGYRWSAVNGPYAYIKKETRKVSVRMLVPSPFLK